MTKGGADRLRQATGSFLPYQALSSAAFAEQTRVILPMPRRSAFFSESMQSSVWKRRIGVNREIGKIVLQKTRGEIWWIFT